MNFFQHQAKAERNTAKLVFLFLAAIVAIITSLYFVGVLVSRKGAWQPDLLLKIGGVSLAVIVLGSLLKIAALRGGGKAIAERLGGRQVVTGTRDPLEKQLINVVEEMSIASGLPCPLVYVMDGEVGINAFAAGYTPNDAVVAVTRGCLEQLNRDELQGVIAHEFSHILNGDMRLNIRLIGILSGILIIGIMGYGVMRVGMYTAGSRSSREGGGAGMAILVIGALVTVIGFVGLFFGRLIKAAVSRQREFLADASAVALTRDPSGLAGALKTIGGHKKGGRIQTRYAEEASHMFFARGLSPAKLFSDAMATHPPLGERIKRIDKGFDAKAERAARPRRAPSGARAGAEGISAMVGAAQAAAVVGMVGAPTREHLEKGAAIVEGMPEAIHLAAHDPLGAVSLSYALLLDTDKAARQHQLKVLGESAAAPIVAETMVMYEHVKELDPRLRLPALDLAVPALRTLGPDRSEIFLADVRRLVEADDKLTLFEFALQTLLRHRIGKVQRRTAQYQAMKPLDGDVSVLLSVLAGFGHTDVADAEEAYRKGIGAWAHKRPAPDMKPHPPQAMEKALDKLSLASAPIKARIVEACAHCVLADDEVTLEEAELLRVVCVALDCPLPPFLT